MWSAQPLSYAIGVHTALNPISSSSQPSLLWFCPLGSCWPVSYHVKTILCLIASYSLCFEIKLCNQHLLKWNFEQNTSCNEQLQYNSSNATSLQYNFVWNIFYNATIPIQHFQCNNSNARLLKYNLPHWPLQTCSQIKYTGAVLQDGV